MQMTETGKTVYDRTYSRSGETWEETVDRVVRGNISLVPDGKTLPGEEEKLRDMILEGALIPAGRQLYMTGCTGRQFLFNCHVSGWGPILSDHFEFTFMRLMEGGGVGANYSSRFISDYKVWRPVHIKLYCRSDHPDYEELKPYLQKEIYIGIPRKTTLTHIDDSREGWSGALSNIIDAATVYQSEYPNGKRYVDNVSGQDDIVLHFDLSWIRASGSEIKTFGGTAAGPVPLAKLLKGVEEVLNSAWLSCGFTFQDAMEIDHAISECVISGNVRRSARMSIMHWNDPNIFDFINIKKDPSKHWSTNISVEIDSDFIEYIGDNCSPESEGDIADRSKARKVYREILSGMLTNGEPGIWNSTYANSGEPNKLLATNPCGEIGLEAWEACCLGHVNLAAFVKKNGKVDYDRLFEAHVLMTRFLVRATFGDAESPEQRNVMNRNRRIGVGHLGLQWFLNAQGIKYSEASRDEYFMEDLFNLYGAVRRAAREYAFQLRIPEPVKVTTIAPTGSIAKLFGVSEGIHPIYAKYFIRRIRFSMIDPRQIKQVEDYRRRGHNVIPDIYSANTVVVEVPTRDPLLDHADEMFIESADEVSIEDMLSMLRLYQSAYADNSVSYTINIPEGSVTPERLGAILLEYIKDIKGVTIMVDGARPLAPYERISKEEFFEYEEFFTETSGDGECASGACPVR
jgi:ribonucleoside-triphosphate reductase (thioredoxin)